MKLSKLKALVKSIEAHAPAGSDPGVRFWIPRPEGMPAGPKDSTQFLEFHVECDGDIDNLVWSNKIVASSAECLPEKGDFDIPLAIVPFYR